MRLSKEMRKWIRHLRTELANTMNRENSGINHFQIRYATEYGLLFLEFHSALGHHSRKVLVLKNLETSTFPEHHIACLVKDLKEGLNAAARVRFPRDPFTGGPIGELKVHFTPHCVPSTLLS